MKIQMSQILWDLTNSMEQTNDSRIVRLELAQSSLEIASEIDSSKMHVVIVNLRQEQEKPLAMASQLESHRGHIDSVYSK